LLSTYADVYAYLQNCREISTTKVNMTMDAVINFSRAAHKVSDHSTLSQTAVMSCHDYPMDMDKYIII
jgi:hypothetical protein